MLILDLDDTLFETSSINPQLFHLPLSLIQNYYAANASRELADKVITELWSNPLDKVFATYGTPKAIIAEFYQKIGEIDFRQLSIQPFVDYEALRSLPQRKRLVTTGLKELQQAKIEALGIATDFEAVYIDDPRLQPRTSKIDIFKAILLETQLEPSAIWVIGDNPESEIKAGKTLGMKTVQRVSKSKGNAGLADYVIHSFEELEGIWE